MRKGLFKLFIVPFFVLNAFNNFGQQAEGKDKSTPYELLSSYYNSGNFKPFSKSNWYLGLSFSLDDQHRANTKGIIQNVVQGDNLRYNIELKGGYYTQEYNRIGLNIGYFQNGFDGVVFQDPDTIQSNSLTRGYTITPNLRTSIPLTKNERLSFFIEVDLMFSNSNTLSRQVKNIDEVTKNYATQYGLGVGLNPGVTFFAMEAFAFEIQLNVFGYDVNVTNTELNGLEESTDVKQSLHLDLNLLTLDLGLAYYFGANK